MRPLLFVALCCAARGFAAEPVVAVARFVCDDKQASADTCDEQTWRTNALKSPREGTDLFAHDQGGPEGAVWNGGAAIVLFVKGSGAVTLNGAKVATSTEGEWRWVRVPAAQWQKLARPARGHAYEQVTVRVGNQVVGAWWFASGE